VENSTPQTVKDNQLSTVLFFPPKIQKTVTLTCKSEISREHVSASRLSQRYFNGKCSGELMEKCLPNLCFPIQRSIYHWIPQLEMFSFFFRGSAPRLFSEGFDYG